MATPYVRVSGKCSVVVYSRRGDSKSLPNSNYTEDREKRLFSNVSQNVVDIIPGVSSIHPDWIRISSSGAYNQLSHGVPGWLSQLSV